jgi:hypothetical protein
MDLAGGYHYGEVAADPTTQTHGIVRPTSRPVTAMSQPPHTLHLVDIQPEYAAAFERAFEACPNVTVTCANMLTVAKNAIVASQQLRLHGWGYRPGVP